MDFEHQLASGTCSQPFSHLGWQQKDSQTTVTVWFQHASSVSLVDVKTGKKLANLKQTRAGVFSVTLPKTKQKYRVYEVLVLTQEGEHRYLDPYQFQDFAYQALHYIDHAPENLYRQAGAQLTSVETDGKVIDGVRFAVFAPNASAVSLIGDFNYWDKNALPMQRSEMGYWVLFVPGIKSGAEYKYAVRDAHGTPLPDKSDPLGFSQHQYPSHASVVYDHDAYKWNDAKWQKAKQKSNPYHQAMSMIEVHLGSWKRPDDPDRRYLSYKEMAEDLVAYVKDMGFTHIEVLPVSEFPFDGSWGYQPVGLFAPTSRFGSPDDFKFFVDKCHQAGIGVIIDWVPAHFPEDGHGLARFDGTHVYEYEDPRKGWHPDWNSCIYDFGKDTVRQFLVANALFWFDKFKVDGIRVDAVASMLYLDYSRNDGEWIPNVDGGNHNYEAISLLKWMNTEVYAKFPHAVTIAEESTSFAGVSRPVSSGGLGFGFKWNMGWMHDSLHYIAKDPAYRRYHHGELTFSMVYAFDENFVLPISHDEVVHGKGSMLQKMPGDDWQKFANLRAYYGFMFAHPGKKLQFMGNELAPWNEWNHDASLNWSDLEFNPHAGMQQLYKALNHLYQNEKALHQLDHAAEGFQWIDLHNNEQSVLSFARYAKDAKETIIAVSNFTPLVQQNFRLGVPQKGDYQLLLNSDDKAFGGSGYWGDSQENSLGDVSKPIIIESQEIAWNELGDSIEIKLPPLATLFFKRV